MADDQVTGTARPEEPVTRESTIERIKDDLEDAVDAVADYAATVAANYRAGHDGYRQPDYEPAAGETTEE